MKPVQIKYNNHEQRYIHLKADTDFCYVGNMAQNVDGITNKFGYLIYDYFLVNNTVFNL